MEETPIDIKSELIDEIVCKGKHCSVFPFNIISCNNVLWFCKSDGFISIKY